jgi:uncharacterized protein YbdZ (MbtH family)
VANRIAAAIEDARYDTWRFLSIPRGFALVSQLERIRPDGTPLPDKERFRSDVPSFAELSFVELLMALAKAPPGHYRVIVFVVTDTPFEGREPLWRGHAAVPSGWIEGCGSEGRYRRKASARSARRYPLRVTAPWRICLALIPNPSSSLASRRGVKAGASWAPGRFSRVK